MTRLQGTPLLRIDEALDRNIGTPAAVIVLFGLGAWCLFSLLDMPRLSDTYSQTFRVGYDVEEPVSSKSGGMDDEAGTPHDFSAE